MILCRCAWVQQYSHWLVRLSLAGTFIYHGIGKFPTALAIAEMFSVPVVIVYLAGLVEIVGGVAILWGGLGDQKTHKIATKFASGIFAITMLSAIFMFHLENGWSFISGFDPDSNGLGGMEFQVLIFAVSMHLFIHEGFTAKR